MSLGDAGKKRREQIKSLRSKRTALLKQRDLSIKVRMAAQQDAQQDAQELIEQKRQQIMSSCSSNAVRDDLLEQLSEIESIASTLSPTELEVRIKSIKSKYKPIYKLVYVR